MVVFGILVFNYYSSFSHKLQINLPTPLQWCREVQKVTFSWQRVSKQVKDYIFELFARFGVSCDCYNHNMNQYFEQNGKIIRNFKHFIVAFLFFAINHIICFLGKYHQFKLFLRVFWNKGNSKINIIHYPSLDLLMLLLQTD